MTKTTKAILAGAAFAGLFAGTTGTVRASNLFPSLKTSYSTQDQGQSDDQKADKKVKEKHVCKGQNSRSEERRVGKECRSRWSRYHKKKKEEDRGVSVS